MAEPTHKKRIFSIADLLFLKCPCTVTLAVGLIGKSNGLRDIIAQFQFYSDKCAMMITTQSCMRIVLLLNRQKFEG